MVMKILDLMRVESILRKTGLWRERRGEGWRRRLCWEPLWKLGLRCVKLRCVNWLYIMINLLYIKNLIQSNEEIEVGRHDHVIQNTTSLCGTRQKKGLWCVMKLQDWHWHTVCERGDRISCAKCMTWTSYVRPMKDFSVKVIIIYCYC